MHEPNAAPNLGSWPTSESRGVGYGTLKVSSMLRRAAEPEGGWHWTLNPYLGCEFACTFCQERLDRKEYPAWRDFERKIGIKVNAAEALARELRSEDFQGRPVVLGTSSEPWQQAEEHLRLTRALLGVLAGQGEVDLRVSTRSSLIARDTDLLLQIAEKGQVSVTFSLASLDDRINRLMEPRAPTAFRRLAAFEALARAGLAVGVMVSPVLPGLDEDELGLEALLSRAANAGARFAGMRFLQLGPGQRENFLAHVTTAYPQLATRFRRVVGLRAPSEAERQSLADAFAGHCQRLGLAAAPPIADDRPRRAQPPSQLALFGT